MSGLIKENIFWHRVKAKGNIFLFTKKRKSSIYGTNKNQNNKNKKDPVYYIRCLNRM